MDLLNVYLQVVTIQKAQIARQEKFMFEGVELPLKASCSVFITMNPGYAGTIS